MADRGRSQLGPRGQGGGQRFDDVAWAWADWWEEHWKEWDDEVVDRVRNALDRVIVYEVVKVALEP